MSRKKHTITELSRRYEKEASFDEDVVKKTLLKKAKGFVLEEISEEYSKEEGGSLKLVKRKVVTKEVAPDISAIKVLIEMSTLSTDKYKSMTDEELLKEKDRLIKLLEGVKEEESID